MNALGSAGGIAAPIVVGGGVWGALGAAYANVAIPVGAERRLERFAQLLGVAISNADAWHQLAREASTDGLTGLANRRSFDERLTAELARARRYGRGLSLVLLDLDHFKRINDTYGHQAGDEVLIRFASLLLANAREGELVARIGGEEFAWLMPETDEEGAHNAAERARTALAEELFAGIGTLTVSAGVRAVEDQGSAEELIRGADDALYWAKNSGRNTTFRYSSTVAAGV
jgi:diguanylate cyclase (GGDEF)-like protein